MAYFEEESFSKGDDAPSVSDNSDGTIDTPAAVGESNDVTPLIDDNYVIKISDAEAKPVLEDAKPSITPITTVKPKKSSSELKEQRRRERAKNSFKFFRGLRCAILILPVALCISIAFDIFNSHNGYFHESAEFPLGLAIFLFIVLSIASVSCAIFINISMFNEQDIDKYGKIKKRGKYNAAAGIVFAVCFIIASINLINIVSHINDDKVVFHGGDVKVRYYLSKDAEMTLPTSHFKSNKDEGDYYTKYYLSGWRLGEEILEPGASFNPEGWQHLTAVYDDVDYAELRVSTSGASISVSYVYNGETVTGSSSPHVIPLGARVTCTVTYTYPNSKETTFNGSRISLDSNGQYTFDMQYHSSISAKSVSNGCLVLGDLITMADGTKKPVEELESGDVLLAFNHETGKLEPTPMLVNVHALEKEKMVDVINLEFSDGNTLRIADEHGLFDLDLNRYVYITAKNYSDYITHRFASVKYKNGSTVIGEATLSNAYITKEQTKIFNPATVWHINLVANDMLTLSAGMTNLFEYGVGMKYDESKMRKDIEKYGLYTYEDFKDYVPKEVYEAFPFKYYRVSVGKGNFTFERIIDLINYFKDANSLK